MMHNPAISPLPVLWTNELIVHFAGLWVSGRTTSEIAKALNISRSAVVGKVKSLRPEYATASQMHRYVENAQA
ncbi:MAG: GcrA cell cycle regulator [Devosia sp.]|nr:GcrA cell cycle regulator [Devosia sp.]